MSGSTVESSDRPGMSPGAPSRPIRALVADDVLVNQRLISAMLERRGHQAVCVGNGLDAIEAATSGAFDVILMDLEMPGASGFEATSSIREGERALGRRTPIIALTAHDSAADRERCLAAGMDGYLAKPVSVAALTGALAQLSGRVTAPAPPSVATPGGDTPGAKPSGAFDSTELLYLVDGDTGALRRLITMFSRETPLLLETLREAVRRGDAALVGKTGHKLRGSAANFSAARAAGLAARLEAMGKTNDLAGSAEVMEELDRETGRLLLELQIFAASRAG
jgi:CheY-like chemotaxis protein